MGPVHWWPGMRLKDSQTVIISSQAELSSPFILWCMRKEWCPPMEVGGWSMAEASQPCAWVGLEPWKYFHQKNGEQTRKHKRGKEYYNLKLSCCSDESVILLGSITTFKDESGMYHLLWFIFIQIVHYTNPSNKRY